VTDREEILCNKLIAAGGWLRRAMDKWRVLAIEEAAYALVMAHQAIEEAIKIVRAENHGRHDETLPKM
jgi:hypothetical protein